MELVSVVVPIYKVEKYLPTCLASIVNQTYNNLQIILVDDGSPDACGRICEEWKQKDLRIEVIHKKNGGLSDARNCGVAAAKGEYICFIDSDDLVDCQYVEWMLAAAQKHRVPLVACDVDFFPDGEMPVIQHDSPHIKKYTAYAAMCDIIHGRGVRAVAWNKLYSADLIRDERFELGKCHEDEFYTYRIVDKAQNSAYLQNVLYHYRQRQGSIMDTFSAGRIDALEAYTRRLMLLEKKYHDLYLQDKINFCISCVLLYCMANQHMKSRDIDIRAIKKKIKMYRNRISFSAEELKECSLKETVYIIMGRYCMDGFSYLLNHVRGKNDE